MLNIWGEEKEEGREVLPFLWRRLTVKSRESQEVPKGMEES